MTDEYYLNCIIYVAIKKRCEFKVHLQPVICNPVVLMECTVKVMSLHVISNFNKDHTTLKNYLSILVYLRATRIATVYASMLINLSNTFYTAVIDFLPFIFKIPRVISFSYFLKISKVSLIST